MYDLEIFLFPPRQSKLLTEQSENYDLPTINENDLSDGVFLRQTAATASQYCNKVTALYCHSPPLATLQDVKNAETYRAALEYVIDQSAGNLFDLAIRQCCTHDAQALLAADETEVREVLGDLIDAAGEEHTQNMLAHKDYDEIFPPTNTTRMSPPSTFPRTVHDLRCLREGALLNEIEDFYGLAHAGDLESRIHNVRRVYGIIRFARAPAV